jgi:hypothetical protein
MSDLPTVADVEGWSHDRMDAYMLGIARREVKLLRSRRGDIRKESLSFPAC